MEKLFVIALMLYGVGVLLALSARSETLKRNGIFCVIIVLLYFSFMASLLDGLSHAGAGAAFAGAGIAFIGMFGGIIALPALGFVIGWFAKLFQPKDVKLFSLINYTLMTIVILGPVLLFYTSVLHPEIKRKSERKLASQEMRRQSEMRRKSEMNFFKNTRKYLLTSATTFWHYPFEGMLISAILALKD